MHTFLISGPKIIESLVAIVFSLGSARSAGESGYAILFWRPWSFSEAPKASLGWSSCANGLCLPAFAAFLARRHVGTAPWITSIRRLPKFQDGHT